MLWKVYIRQHPIFGPWYRRVEGRPSWVWKITILTAILLIGVPLALLTIAALFVAAAVFVTLSVVALAIAAVRNMLAVAAGPPAPRDDGRRNVRVVER